MRQYLIIILSFLVLAFACNNEDCQVTKDFIYNKKGISSRLTVQLLKVEKLNTNNFPEIFENDTVRIDLEYNGTGTIKKKIYFNKFNDGYDWLYNFPNKYKTFPIEFINDRWYNI